MKNLIKVLITLFLVFAGSSAFAQSWPCVPQDGPYQNPISGYAENSPRVYDNTRGCSVPQGTLQLQNRSIQNQQDQWSQNQWGQNQSAQGVQIVEQQPMQQQSSQCLNSMVDGRQGCYDPYFLLRKQQQQDVAQYGRPRCSSPKLFSTVNNRQGCYDIQYLISLQPQQRQIQGQQVQYVQQPNNRINGCTVVGAAAGAMIGNKIGGGNGRIAAVAAGAVLGGTIGTNNCR